MLRTTLRMLATLAMTAAMAVVGLLATATPAHADACFTWGRTLAQGMSGGDVRQLQIRVSGYPLSLIHI